MSRGVHGFDLCPVSSCQTPTQSCEERDRGESLNQTLFQESVSLSVFTKRSCSWTLDTLTSHHIWLTLRKEQHVKENVSGQVQGASLIVCVCERKWERAGVSEWTFFFFSKFLSLVDVCTDWCCSCGGGLFLDLSVFLCGGRRILQRELYGSKRLTVGGSVVWPLEPELGQIRTLTTSVS